MPRETLIKSSDVVYAVLLAAGAIIAWFFLLSFSGGSYAVIRQDGEVLAELPLGTDAVYEVAGDYTNVFEIMDGELFMAYTDCPNHDCQKAGHVSVAGAAIVCAPNRTSAVIEGEGSEIDALTG